MNPLNDIRALVGSMPAHEERVSAQVKHKLDDATSGLKPLGKLGEAVSWIGAWQGSETPKIKHPMVCVFIGAHGVAQYVLGEDPKNLARKRLETFSDGKAAIRGIAGTHGAAFKIYNMGIEKPSLDMREHASLSAQECAAAIAYGMEVVAEGADLIILGNAGVGGATAAAAIALGLYGGSAQYWASGDDALAKRRIDAVEAATSTHKAILGDPLEILRCFGGRDIAGLVGAMIAARHQKIPVLLDGFVVCAAAAVLHRLDAQALDHCLAAHVTKEPGHGALLDRIGKSPLLDFGIGVGDGSGATLAAGAIMAAVAANQEL